MRAAFCPRPGVIELREVAQAEPAPGEVVLRVRACGICGSDLHWFRGLSPPPAVCPGHEMAGEVAAVGAGIAGVREGDRVAVEPMQTCRECAYCRGGVPQRCARLCILGMRRPGGFAEYVAVPGYGLFALPTGMDFALGALAEPMAICVHAVRAAGIGLGQRVLVLGAGSIGLLSVVAARAAGASSVLVTARHPHQAAAATRLGATRIFAASDDGRAERDAATTAEPIDAVIETVGAEAGTIGEAVRAVRPGGIVVMLGVFTTAPTLPALALLAKEVRLVGTMMYDRRGPRADFDVALELLASRCDEIAPLLTHRIGLDDAQLAFDTAADKRAGAIKVSVVG
jgi:2-desacetyl-2-hydroxyethyl bacteriochlorophyllide A dehydrogenase